MGNGLLRTMLAVAFCLLAGPALAACQMATASWYGAESGSRTASGKFFDGSQNYVAHKSLPFGTGIRFTYHGRSIVAVVQDRGPYVRGRTFDLSKAAARRLGLIPAGVGRVCWEKVG